MRIRTLSLVLAGIALFTTMGCGAKQGEITEIDGPPPAIEHLAPHAHEGPHGGQVIELGKEEYHAELVRNENDKSILVYVLDSAAKNSVAIDATEVSINLKHEGKREQFKLGALPTETDPPGKSSRFVSNHSELAVNLDEKTTDAHLVLEIAGAQFRGKIKPGEEHAGDRMGHKHQGNR